MVIFILSFSFLLSSIPVFPSLPFFLILSVFLILSSSFLILFLVYSVFLILYFPFKKKVCKVFKPWRETRSVPSLFQDCVLPQIFKLIVSSNEKILDNLNVVVGRQVKWQNSPPSVTVHGQRLLELHGNLSREKKRQK